MDELAPDAEKVIAGVAGALAKVYAKWVERDDVQQEIVVYYLRHREAMDKLRAKGDYWFNHRMFNAGKLFCENEKAIRSGYELRDVAWYDPAQLAHLIPLVFNSNWDGLSGEDADAGMPRGKSPASEGGTLLTMVCDIRRVLKGKKMQAKDFDPDTESGPANLQRLCEALGGSFPTAPGYVPGRRKEAA